MIKVTNRPLWIQYKLVLITCIILFILFFTLSPILTGRSFYNFYLDGYIINNPLFPIQILPFLIPIMFIITSIIIHKQLEKYDQIEFIELHRKHVVIKPRRQKPISFNKNNILDISYNLYKEVTEPKAIAVWNVVTIKFKNENWKTSYIFTNKKIFNELYKWHRTTLDEYI